MLKSTNVVAGYGKIAVIHDINIEVRSGEIVALLGNNGSGKTTLLLSLIGELPLISGEVQFYGGPVRGPLFRRARGGMAFVSGERSVFKTLSTFDNLRVGRGNVDYALELFPELKPRLKVLGGLLSGGEQQILALARALSREPKILIADELSLGLAPMIVQRLLRAARAAATEQGTAVLLVEQQVRKSLQYADRAYIMRRGRMEFEGTVEDMKGRIDEIEAAYLALKVPNAAS